MRTAAMLLKVTLLVIAGTIASSYAHCHHGVNIGWRNEPTWRDAHPTWRLSPFGDTFAPFDEDWHFYNPQHQIFSSFEQPHDMRGNEVEGPSKCCHQEREKRDNQRRIEEELSRRRQLESLNREEEELERKWQQRSEEFQREQAEFQQRKELISQQKASHDNRRRETTPTSEPDPRKQSISESQRWEEEQQRVAAEQQRRQHAEQETERLRQEALKERKRQQLAREQIHARQRDRILLAKHQVTGYDPDDIIVTVDEDKVKVEGRHICHCNENCITKEFARSYPLTVSIDSGSLSATMDEQGNVKIFAERSREGERDGEVRKVTVEGLNIPQTTKPSVEELRTCLSKKGGIKLSKVNKRTGRVHVDDYKYDHEVLGNNQPIGSDYDIDEGFVETEDY